MTIRQDDYVGFKPCGCCVTWASSDQPAKDLAKTVAGVDP